MREKFTVPQFNDIVKQQEEYFPNDMVADGFLGRTLAKSYQILNAKYEYTIEEIENSKNKFLALFNPLTRELVYDKYVEKEKKYYWTSKGEDSKGLKRRLYIKADRVRDYFEDEFLYNENEVLTEQQVYQWGYNPEMFEREEV